MSKVKILRRMKDDASGKTGLSKYADDIEKCLNEQGIEYDLIQFKIDARDGYIDLFRKGFIGPFRASRKDRSKENIIHATDELCGIFFSVTRGKKIVTVHHVPIKGEYRGGTYYRLWHMVAKTALKNADRIIAVSEQTKAEVLERFKVDPGKIVCITNAVNSIFDIRSGIDKEKMIGCIGALIPRKNFSSSMTAFKKLTDHPGMSEYVLEICGKGPEKENLVKKASELGIEGRVRFVSDLDEEEVARFYNRAALIFNTSSHEGLGLATLEAQKCSVPVLHLQEARIPEEVTRFSVPCRDETDMAEKAFELLSDKERYDEVSRASKEYADSFGMDFCKNYTEIIRGTK